MDDDIELHGVPSASTMTTKRSENGHDQDSVDTTKRMPDLEALEQTSPTLGRSRMRKRFLGPQQRLDELDLLLKSQVPDGDQPQDFMKDWLHFKQKPGSGTLFEAVFEYRISHPPVYPSSNHMLPKTHTTDRMSSSAGEFVNGLSLRSNRMIFSQYIGSITLFNV